MKYCFMLLLMLVASCAEHDSGIVSPVSSTSSSPPVATPPPSTPSPAPVPHLDVTVAQIVFGNPWFAGPQDAWHVVFNYDYEPDPAYPYVVVKTYYQWGSTFRQNVKIWDCTGGRRVITDDFFDYAWSEPLIEYSVQVFAANVIDGDWYNGFCMGEITDYWGTVDPMWLYCPIDGQHPNGLRLASALVTSRSMLPTRSFLIRVLGYAQVTVQ